MASSVSRYIKNVLSNLNTNYIVNGGFQVWQRGTSLTYGGSGNQGFADRWFGKRSSDETGMTVVKQTSSDGFSIAKVQRTAGNTTNGDLTIAQAIDSEIVKLNLAGKKITFSTLVQLAANYSSVSGVKINIYSGTVSEDSVTPYGFTTGNVLLGSITTAKTLGSWLNPSLTVDVPSNAQSLLVQIVQTAPQGTASTIDGFYVAKAKLETGVIQTPFQYETTTEVIRKCLDYYERITAVTSNSPAGIVGFADGTSTVRAYVFYQYKRKTPTITPSGATAFSILRNGTDTTSTAVSTATTLPNRVRLDITTAGAVVGGEGLEVGFTNSSQYLEFNAENF